MIGDDAALKSAMAQGKAWLLTVVQWPDFASAQLMHFLAPTAAKPNSLNHTNGGFGPEAVTSRCPLCAIANIAATRAQILTRVHKPGIFHGPRVNAEHCQLKL
jgi:hypothetical protein